MGDPSYNYGNSLRGVERQILQADGEQLQTNSFGSVPKIVVLRGPNIPTGDDDVGSFSRRQTFNVLFKLADQSNCVDIQTAIDDMERALFATEWVGNNRLFDYSIDLADPQTQELMPGPQLTFSIVYNVKIGDPTSG